LKREWFQSYSPAQSAEKRLEEIHSVDNCAANGGKDEKIWLTTHRQTTDPTSQQQSILHQLKIIHCPNVWKARYEFKKCSETQP